MLALTVKLLQYRQHHIFVSIEIQINGTGDILISSKFISNKNAKVFHEEVLFNKCSYNN